ncbi:MAG: flagellar basal body L-ring protein FlgH [Deltaproteobacteria bacterium]|nr:flagellar basal body L-ring protein FlgH [Deltaproteobacteria bacterium]
MTYKHGPFSVVLIWAGLFSFVFPALSGCAGSLKETRPLKEDFVYEIKDNPPVRHEGSLWQDNGPLSVLFVNPKARAVGDIVTIKIVESSAATNKATTGTDRKSSLDAGIDGFLGMEKRYPTSSHPNFNPFSAISGSISSQFSGAGTTQRSGNLTAYITARISEVLPNGNFVILGSRQVTVNNEEQFITLSGIVRPRDISPDNVILSTYISDAKIKYSGSGIVNDRQRPGWLARLLDTVWPF